MHNQNILVSVAMPVYKPNFIYLEAAINSVLTQTHPNFELVISDDTPNDTVENFIEKNYKNYKIKYVRNISTPGIFYNLNNAINSCKGDYIQILCQDDVLYTNCLTQQLYTLLKFPNAGFVYSQVNQIDENSMLFKKIEINFGNKSMYRTPKDTINLLFKHGCLPGNLSPVMLPKKTIESIGLFNPEFTYVGDFEYWIRIVENNFGMAVNFSPLLELRHHKDRASISLGKIVWVRDICKCYKKLLEKNTLKKWYFFQILYINEKVGIQAIKAVTRSITKSKKISNLKLLLCFPLNLFLIVILFFISMNGRIKLIKINEIKFDNEN